MPIVRFSFAILILLGSTIVASAQVDPVENLQVDRLETRNFEIVMERSVEHPRPTIKEIGILVERLCAQLDKIFLKYAPHRVADESVAVERLKKEGPESKKSAISKNETAEDDPDRIIPKCKIFIFNTRRAFEAKCRFDGIEPPGENYAGFFTTKTNSTYMMRSWSVQNTRETLLHETTHYYTFNFLPGGFRCYPQWFHEGMATSYEKHFWNGDKLVIGTQPRIQKYDAPASALVDLLRLRRYLQQEKGDAFQSEDDTASEVPSTSKRTKKPETPIDPGLIQPFLDTMFTPEQFQKDRVPLKDPGEAVSRQYAMYEAIGRFLLAARPDHLGAILRQTALWEKEKDRTFPRKDRFVEAWKKVAAAKPITVEEIGRWVQKNQLPFQWTYGDWQDIGDQIAGKAQEGKISILALRDPKAMPKFTVFPKNITKFQAGVVINFIDNDHFGAVLVNEEGDVLQMEQIRGEWTGGKRIGKTSPIPNRNSPYGNGASFQFATAQQGGMIAVRINNVVVGTYPRNPKACCGFFLSSTEAIFTY